MWIREREELSIKRQVGVTLIELLVTVVVLGILATVAVPSFSNFLDKQRILGAAQSVTNFIKLARTESLKTSSSSIFVVDNTSSGWCVGITTASGAASCDCFALSSCTVNGQLQAVTNENFPNVVMDTPVVGSTTTAAFESVRGTISSPTPVVEFSNTTGGDLTITSTLLGSTSTCNNGSSYGGYPEC